MLYRASRFGVVGRFRGERHMSESEKHADYLSKAKEADEMADKASSPVAEKARRQIANNYRELHKLAQSTQG